MGSSFLTTINVGLGLYSIILFLKLIIQFGLPNHPVRFTMYLVSLCATAFFTMKAIVGLGFIPPVEYMKLRVLPLVIGSLALLLQVITTIGQFSLIQQKIVSRMPLIAGLLVFAFFPQKAEVFFAACVLTAALFLSVSVGKARYQKRIFFKMFFFLVLFSGSVWINHYWVYVLGELLLFPSLFYFFVFQQTFGVSALVSQFQSEDLGVHS